MVIVRNRISFFTSDQNQTEEPQQTPPWVKEMKDKGKSFRKPDQKEIKPEPEITKQEYMSPPQKELKVIFSCILMNSRSDWPDSLVPQLHWLRAPSCNHPFENLPEPSKLL